MSETKINLEEIALNFHGGATFAGLENCYYEHEVIKAMKEACKQVLELAAENAKINWIENNVEMESDSDFAFRDTDGNWCKINTDTQSILDTIKQVE